MGFLVSIPAIRLGYVQEEEGGGLDWKQQRDPGTCCCHWDPPLQAPKYPLPSLYWTFPPMTHLHPTHDSPHCLLTCSGISHVCWWWVEGPASHLHWWFQCVWQWYTFDCTSATFTKVEHKIYSSHVPVGMGIPFMDGHSLPRIYKPSYPGHL